MPTLKGTPQALVLVILLVMGYSFSKSGQRQFFSQIMLTLAVTIVLALVVDLDRPRRGFIHVTQRPMIDLQRNLRR